MFTDRKNEKPTSPIIAGQRNRRNSDSTVFCLPKGNDESALLSLLKQAVIKQERIERQGEGKVANSMQLIKEGERAERVAGVVNALDRIYSGKTINQYTPVIFVHV